MKKNEKKQSKGAARSKGAHRIVGENGAIDWAPLLGLTRAAVDWTHHLAAELCRPEERVLVDRVFREIPAVFDGEHVDIPLQDVLLALRVVGRGIERDQGIAAGAFDLLASVLGFAFAPIEEIQAQRAAMAPLVREPAPRTVNAPAPLPSLAAVFALINSLAGPMSHRAAPTFHSHR